MAKFKPMTPEAKARLREYAEKKRAETRGRTSLRGIDPLGWAGAIDTVLAADVLPTVTWRADGSLRVVYPDDRPGVYVSSWMDGGVLRSWWMGQQREAHRMRYGALCPWAILTGTRPGQEDDLARAFDHRRIRIPSYAGPEKGQTSRDTVAFPVAAVVAVFAQLWPNKAEGDQHPEWVAKLLKYACGYTEKSIAHFAVAHDQTNS